MEKAAARRRRKRSVRRRAPPSGSTLWQRLQRLRCTCPRRLPACSHGDMLFLMFACPARVGATAQEKGACSGGTGEVARWQQGPARPPCLTYTPSSARPSCLSSYFQLQTRCWRQTACAPSRWWRSTLPTWPLWVHAAQLWHQMGRRCLSWVLSRQTSRVGVGQRVNPWCGWASRDGGKNNKGGLARLPAFACILALSSRLLLPPAPPLPVPACLQCATPSCAAFAATLPARRC